MCVALQLHYFLPAYSCRARRSLALVALRGLDKVLLYKRAAVWGGSMPTTPALDAFTYHVRRGAYTADTMPHKARTAMAHMKNDRTRTPIRDC